VPVLPRDHGIAEYDDPLDLRLDHVARLQVERRGVLTEPRHAAEVPVEET